MNMPPAIIFINSDLITHYTDGYYLDGQAVNPDGYINNLTRNLLEQQLWIDETMTFREFSARVSVDPNYHTVVHLQSKRILVILTDFYDVAHRNLADLVLFYTHGMVYVEKNNYGPPGLTLPLERLNLYVLLRNVGSRYVTILPPTATKPPNSLG